jgi:hypothetical protein
MMDYSNEILELRDGPFVPTRRILEDPSLSDNNHTKNFFTNFFYPSSILLLDTKRFDVDETRGECVDRAILDDLMQWAQEEDETNEETYIQWEENTSSLQGINQETTSLDSFDFCSSYSSHNGMKEEQDKKEEEIEVVDTYLTQKEHDTMTALLDEFLLVVDPSVSHLKKSSKRKRSEIEDPLLVLKSKKKICSYPFCGKAVRARDLCCRHLTFQHCVIPKCKRLRLDGHHLCLQHINRPIGSANPSYTSEKQQRIKQQRLCKPGAIISKRKL